MASLMRRISELATLRRKTKRMAREKSLPPKRAPLPHRIPVKRRSEKVFLGFLFSLALLLVVAVDGKGFSFGSPAEVSSFMGLSILVVLLNMLFAKYISTFQREVAASFGKLLLFFLLTLVVVGCARASVFNPSWPPFLIPISFLAVVLAAAVNQRFAFEATCYVMPFVGLILRQRFDGSELFVHVLVPYLGALTALLAARSIRRRSTLMRIGFITGLTQVATLVAMVCVLRFSGEWGELTYLLYGIGCAFAHGVGMGVVVLGTLPVLEYVFSVTTDITLLELSDQYEQPVLKKLLLEAPGTHHHSMMVATLAEAAAARIGCNGLLARVGALYHDIGKMNKPEYFAENGEEVARELHDSLTPAMSTLVICAHPKDGMELGRYYDLPPSVLDFVEQHHGDTLVEFFFDKARRLKNVSEPMDESAFRYPGPRPQTKEVGIVMLADCVEATSRGLKDPNSSRIETLIHGLVMKRLLDHQLDDCALTLRELAAIEDAFNQVLVGVFHKRPKYPENMGRGRGSFEPPRVQKEKEEVIPAEAPKGPVASGTKGDGSFSKKGELFS